MNALRPLRLWRSYAPTGAFLLGGLAVGAIYLPLSDGTLKAGVMCAAAAAGSAAVGAAALRRRVPR